MILLSLSLLFNKWNRLKHISHRKIDYLNQVKVYPLKSYNFLMTCNDKKICKLIKIECKTDFSVLYLWKIIHFLHFELHTCHTCHSAIATTLQAHLLMGMWDKNWKVYHIKALYIRPQSISGIVICGFTTILEFGKHISYC